MEENTQSNVNLNDSNVLAALCYIPVIGLIFYVLKKEDAFVQFHAKQGVVLLVLAFLTWVPFVGWLLAPVILVAMIVGALKAYKGEKFKLPVIGDLAEKYVTF